ncbi:MAG: ornithine aminomutase [Firmicutes bacterium HGW-Firmicutes-19]|jgi:D-ornithine 4,5-aminomutase subunit alpha|nr:MAG: ornithine aminomutase [Firmicutes bacterium HGW-Firmicutes-19]
MKRLDDFENRRESLKGLSDQQLHQRFWQLSQQLVDPLIDLAKSHTTPSIERSVLLRMGASSIEASTIVGYAIANGVIGSGVGHCIVKVKNHYQLSVRQSIERCMDESFFIENFKPGGVLNESV